MSDEGRAQDYYDTLIVQRGAAEAAACLADECRKLRAALEAERLERDEWKERATVYAQALIDIRDSSDVIVPSMTAHAALRGAGREGAR